MDSKPPSEAFERTPFNHPLFSEKTKSEIISFTQRIRKLLEREGRKITPEIEEHIARLVLQELREDVPHKAKSTTV